MDTGEGEFILADRIEELRALAEEKYPKAKGIFTRGEIIEIRGSRFKVAKIDQFGIKLRLLKGDSHD